MIYSSENEFRIEKGGINLQNKVRVYSHYSYGSIGKESGPEYKDDEIIFGLGYMLVWSSVR